MKEVFPQLNNKAEKEEKGKTLYHFSLDPGKIQKTGFRSSEFIDEGIGARGKSLMGTYFFEDLDAVKNYTFLTENIEKRHNRKGKNLVAELDSDAKILDSSKDNNALYMKEVNGFRAKSNLEPGTLEFSREFTKYLREKGYDAIKIFSSLLGNHTEIIVINEGKLKYKGELQQVL